MQDVVVGLVALAVGALFCFRGYLTLRVVIPVWGAFAGFMLGAGIVASATDEGLLRSLAAWLVGLGLAVVFGLLAYLYYEVSVFLAMAAIGFALGTSLMVALGVTWSWLIVGVGVVAGAVLAVIAIAADLPMLLLVVLSTLAGATTMVGGLMLLLGAAETADFTSATATERLDDDWWWYALYAVLVIVGLISQVRATQRLHESLRSAWEEDRGRRTQPA